jgi:hypothetical protein
MYTNYTVSNFGFDCESAIIDCVLRDIAYSMLKSVASKKINVNKTIRSLLYTQSVHHTKIQKSLIQVEDTMYKYCLTEEEILSLLHNMRNHGNGPERYLLTKKCIALCSCKTWSSGIEKSSTKSNCRIIKPFAHDQIVVSCYCTCVTIHYKFTKTCHTIFNSPRPLEPC